MTSERARQQALNAKTTPRRSTREIDRFCQPDASGSAPPRKALARLNLSARAYHRVLRVARSIADLAACEAIAAQHIAEAVQYRRFARD